MNFRVYYRYDADAGVFVGINVKPGFATDCDSPVDPAQTASPAA